MSIEFLLTSLIVVLVPGPGVIYTLSCGLGRGARTGIAAAIGCTIGILPHMAASLLGLAAILHTSAVMFQVVKFLGVAYLVYLAVTAVRDSGAIALDNETQPHRHSRTIVRGVLLNLLNPKLSIFFLAFLPQFVPAGADDALARILAHSVVFMAMTLAVFVVYAIAAAAVRQYVISQPAVMRGLRYAFAGAFGLLGLRLALAER